jgi:hypothetical protein
LILRAHGGQLIHLFADHKEAELEPIAAGLKQTMGWTPGGKAFSVNSAFFQPPWAHPERLFHAREKHGELRSKPIRVPMGKAPTTHKGKRARFLGTRGTLSVSLQPLFQ